MIKSFELLSNPHILFFIFADVIDWMQENLIDQTRTRRAIIIKLKELGLIFKAPTKRHNALPKNVWLDTDSQQLRDLFDEHRENTGK